MKYLNVELQGLIKVIDINIGRKTEMLMVLARLNNLLLNK